MKRSRKICLIILIPFLAVWFFTGGFVMAKFKWFSASGNVFEKSD